ncbi:DUF6683 family protein [Scleromatobacter humisilvae]|uniref:NarX-like N-terminal domain-containing protein n=1 Tax=Scleromatobacter humisilvae TaxID=2897159 RepID=A0A9X2C2X0_9BURK|nr:DUF6683 family protein [Scleromatobacter humisilvae]MCK9686555.1 hypothetical protein [Scleromatobacter humisilvae]
MFLRSVLLVAALAVAGAARAQSMPFQGYVEMPANLAPMVMGNQASEMLRQVNRKHAQGGASTLARAGGAPSGPHALAAAAAPDKRADLEARLTRVLAAWQQISTALQLPPDDVAGPVAACIAGSYMVVHDVDLPDADFVALVGQMRAVLQDNPRFTQASPAQRREMYEELAIIGTLLATGREAVRRGQAGPQAGEALRRNARTNLDRLLGQDADRAAIGEHGLAFR